MKLLKTYCLAVTVVALINLWFYIDNSILTSIDKNIPPAENWSNILTGKWEFEMVILSPESKERLSGNVEYQQDSTFLKELSYESFLNNNQESDLILKGKATGKWEIDSSGLWQERTLDCNMQWSYCSTDCEKVNGGSHEIPKIVCHGLNNFNTIINGYPQNDNSSERIEKFTSNKIIINKVIIPDSSSVNLVLTRLKS
jgi:Pyruvate/2-oxoacid:ferredoxin oxidoreductase delta subunit